MIKGHAWKYIFFLFIIVILSFISIPITVYLTKHFFKNGDNDWIGYLGNIIGGILGGVFTLLGVRYAFSLERKKASVQSIPEKLINLEKIKSEISGHEFKSLYLEENQDFNTTDNFINDFLENKQLLLELSSKVNIDIYVSVTKYFNCIDIVKYDLEKFDLESNEIETNIKINKIHTFHLQIKKDLIDLIIKNEDNYFKKLYNQKYPKHIIKEYNSKDYLINMKAKTK